MSARRSRRRGRARLARRERSLRTAGVAARRCFLAASARRLGADAHGRDPQRRPRHGRVGLARRRPPPRRQRAPAAGHDAALGALGRLRRAPSLVTLRGGVRIVSGRNTLTAETVAVPLGHARRRGARRRPRRRTASRVLLAPAIDARHAVRGLDLLGRRAHPAPRGRPHVAGGHLQRGHAHRAPFGPAPPRRLDDRPHGRARHLRRPHPARRRGRRRPPRAAPTRASHADSLVYFRTDRARPRLRPGRARTRRDRARRARPHGRGPGRQLAPHVPLRRGADLRRPGRDGAGPRRDAHGPARRDPLLVTLRGRADGRVDTTLVRAPRLDAARTVAGADTTTVLTAWGGARLVDGRLVAVADSARLGAEPGRGEARPPRASSGARGRPSGRAARSSPATRSRSRAARGRVGHAPRRRAGLLGARGLDRRARAAARRRPHAGLLRGRQPAPPRRSGPRPRPSRSAPRARATPPASPGADRLSADSLAVLFEGGQIREVRGYGGVAGTTYGPRIVPEGTRSAGLRVHARGRPDARVRPRRRRLGGALAGAVRSAAPAHSARRDAPSGSP